MRKFLNIMTIIMFIITVISITMAIWIPNYEVELIGNFIGTGFLSFILGIFGIMSFHLE